MMHSDERPAWAALPRRQAVWMSVTFIPGTKVALVFLDDKDHYGKLGLSM